MLFTKTIHQAVQIMVDHLMEHHSFPTGCVTVKMSLKISLKISPCQ